MTAFVRAHPPKTISPANAVLHAAARRSESGALSTCLAAAKFPPETATRIKAVAARWVEEVRAHRDSIPGVESFLTAFDLSSGEGVALMCLAEAMLRVPDADTADALLRDTIGGVDWRKHVGASDSAFVNAATWALMLSENLIAPPDDRGWIGTLRGLAARVGEPVIRTAVREAMEILGAQFVMGRTIEEGLARAAKAGPRTRHSFDMLGEGALTVADAQRNFDRYVAAIGVVGRASDGRGPLDGPGISVKLSAIFPRYEVAQSERVHQELSPRLLDLARLAAKHDISLTVDAEEADRLELSLEVIATVATDPSLDGWEGFGLAIQAYQKRALAVIDRVGEIADNARRRLMVRLVKGAYWDSEIKRAQENGLAEYPVYTRKVNTDVSYLACARRLTGRPRLFYPCFATHNAHTAAAVAHLCAETATPFEFQRLHGMGTGLYDAILADLPDTAVRVYAPVGSHEELLAYLVRRLLENGANTSFVNRLTDAALPVNDIVADPVIVAEALPTPANPRIPLPRDLFAPERKNSAGLDLASHAELAHLKEEVEKAPDQRAAVPSLEGRGFAAKPQPIRNPAATDEVVGIVSEATPAAVAEALERAHKAQPDWNNTPAERRAAILDRAAELFEHHRTALMALAIREAGKTILDALAEVREAVDYLRYYAARARADFAQPMKLPGPTGEINRLALNGRGVFLCISPWNFPLAIFTGQVGAALASGNAVLAKPAEQTPLIAAQAVRLLHDAGVPEDVLHFLPGDGPKLAGAVLGDARLSGVAFTGSTAAAQSINRALAARDGPIATLIAETGGQNAMIADSSALAEQVTRDVLSSAFRTAGQRCSALRALFVQDDVADRFIEMIAGAMAELNVGDPRWLATDVGPVIDAEALAKLQAHVARTEKEGKLIARAPIPKETARGHFLAPHAFEIPRLDYLKEEVFGPVLHIVRYDADDLDAVIDAINATGFGLTASIHSRIDSRVGHIVSRLKVGNIYVNRNQIGAVVGAQPFGGEGLSGTGPKAGGPHYLHRFAVERTISTDTTAKGGNATLLSSDA